MHCGNGQHRGTLAWDVEGGNAAVVAVVVAVGVASP